MKVASDQVGIEVMTSKSDTGSNHANLYPSRMPIRIVPTRSARKGVNPMPTSKQDQLGNPSISFGRHNREGSGFNESCGMDAETRLS